MLLLKPTTVGHNISFNTLEVERFLNYHPFTPPMAQCVSETKKELCSLLYLEYPR
jgi:hypothetical protein